jgi:hypothetical protein
MFQGKKAPPVYKSNIEKTAHIQALREEWKCPKPESVCGATYCYIDPNTQDHIALSHEAMDAWAMGMVSLVCLFSHLSLKTGAPESSTQMVL